MSLSILRRRSDFERLQKTGDRFQVCSWLIFNFQPNQMETLRVGWTLPRYVGTAVVRNRLKRWLREDLKRLTPEISQRPVDLNLVFRRREKDFYSLLEHEEFSRCLEMGLRKMRTRSKAIS